jgi:ankyrin repeat protein
MQYDDVNILQTYRIAPLHIAVQCGHRSVVSLLIKRGSKCTGKDKVTSLTIETKTNDSIFPST